jgi:RNA polymerase sigma-70 factor, ECF subfamily
VPLSDAFESALASNPCAGDADIVHAYEQALAHLSPEQRSVFVLHEAEGMSYQEVAAVLGCPLGTVMSRLHRARARMLEALSERIEELVP